MKIYLAGPVDYSADSGKNWKDELRSSMLNDMLTAVFFDPAVSYKFGMVNKDVSEYIHDVNMYAMHNADWVVARLMRGETSIGTPMELYDAARRGQNIVLITDMDKSVYINYIRYCEQANVVSSVSEAIDILKYDKRREVGKIREGDMLTVCECGGVKRC